MARGGQRWNAGRPGYRVKAEQLQRVDVRIWAKRGLLGNAGAFSWAWNRGGEPTGSIGVYVHSEAALSLRYTITINDDKRDVCERITIAKTACNFGGSRAWFCCPRCPNRVAVLYMRVGRFACRRCQRVAYSSQSEDAIDRSWRNQRKLEARLGDKWQRPKGMRLNTYQRLIERLASYEEARDAAFCVRVGRLFGFAGLA